MRGMEGKISIRQTLIALHFIVPILILTNVINLNVVKSVSKVINK